MVRRFCVAVVVASFVFVAAAAGQSVRVDEGASKVAFRAMTYDLTLVANSAATVPSATLKVEILVPNGTLPRAVSSSEVRLKEGRNRLNASVTLPALPKKQDLLTWYRLQYSIEANGKELARGILPLFDAMQDFSLNASSPTYLQPGKRFFVRVHTRHAVSARALGGAAVTASLRRTDEQAAPLVSVTGTTDTRGYAVLSMLPPSGIPAADLEIAVEARHGAITKEATQDVKVGIPTRILVQTDKPLYQPGQTLHIRALVFGDEHRVVRGKKIYVQVEDEEETIVFREERTSSRFGVVTADWTIPERVRLGDYRVSAKTYPGRYVDEDNDGDTRDYMSPMRESRSVRISRYDLPTFVVNAKPDRPFYLPDQKASVEISADYLFGKPVQRAKVRVAQLASRRWDFAKQKWAIDEEEPIEGVTDDQGRFVAPLDLSSEQQEIEDAYRKFRDVTFTAYVTDPSTGRTEERRFEVRVTQLPIHVYYISEHSSRRGMPGEFFVSTSYADGRAAECDVEVRTMAADGSGERLLATAHTSRYGIARVRDAKTFIPDNGDIPLIITARDRKGARGSTKEKIWRSRDDHFLEVLTKKTILAPEEPVEAEIRSDTNAEIVVELRTEAKVLRSFLVRLHGHGALLHIPYSPEFTGQLEVAATNLERSNRWDQAGLYSQRSVIYPHNRELKVGVRLDQREYRPGQPAVATIQVNSATGTGTGGVIGAVIFDKAVEERARIDQDLRERFGFGGYGGWWYRDDAKLADLTRADLDRVDATQPIAADLDVAADFLLNAYGSGLGPYSPIFGDDDGNETAADTYKQEIDRTLQPALAVLDQERRVSGTLPRDRTQFDELLKRHDLRWSELKDPWGSEFLVDFDLNNIDYLLHVSSPGPDKKARTDDDFVVANRSVSFYLPTQGLITRALRQYHEKTGGFVRDVPALTRALADIGADISKLRDAWGRSYIFDFGINGAQLTVTAKTLGRDGRPGQEFAVGTSSIDYFAEPRSLMDRLLQEKTRGTTPPATASELKSLLAPELRFDDLRDPFGRPYHILIYSVARYSDRKVHDNQKVKTEPITVWTRFIRIRSAGPDGVPNNEDDLDVASFSSVVTEVSASGETSQPSVRAMFTGDTGGISGVVTDPQGLVIPNAIVAAVNVATKVQYETKADAVGSYLLGGLPPGFYDVTIQVPGFRAQTNRGVIVRAQEAVVVNASLWLAAAETTVEVSGEPILLMTQSASISAAPRQASTDLAQQATVTPRLREYFPETLLWQPEVETDSKGRAQIKWKFADNLTTWKLSAIASTLDGRFASTEKEIKSFQPFFVEHDPPKVLTLGDRISLPVVVRNYTDKRELVKVEMPVADWFRAATTNLQEASIEAGANAKLIFPFEATATISAGKQRVIATGGTVADAIERLVTVHPYGTELSHTEARIISGNARLEFDVPADAIPGSIHADLKIYPDLLAHISDALEGMLGKPSGCGEQTISSTYPSLLLLRFEKESKRSLGPLHARASRFVGLGYTRLLTFADESGGFTYWGHGNPDLALTAYAVRFLQDAQEFVPVDAGLLTNARVWLMRQQKADGSWTAHQWYGSSPLDDAILTAYIARVLAASRPSQTDEAEKKNAAAQQAGVRRALDYVAAATKNYSDPYLFADYGLAELAAGRAEQTKEVVSRLRSMPQVERGGSFWELQTNTPFYGWGPAGRVETTALVVQLLDHARHADDARLVERGIEFLIEQKDRYGAWYSTQATVNVIEALLPLASRQNARPPAPLQIVVNGSVKAAPGDRAQTFGPQIIDISSIAHPGTNTVQISGSSGISSAQTVAWYYVPWSSPSAIPAPGPLKLAVRCDRVHLEIGGKVTCDVLVERLGSRGHGMMIAEVGVPPGVDVDRESLLKQLSETGWELSSFDVLPDRVIAYVWPRAAGTRFSITFTPRMAIDAVAAPHVLYDYYNPDASIVVAPDHFVVAEPSVALKQIP